MNLTSYCNLVRALPVPSGAQIEAFSHWVSNAHSWYKRIPLLGKGVPFVLYLDPGAGHDRVGCDGGRWKLVPRTEQGFHYTAIPTADYLERFGHLAFATGNALRAGTVLDGTPETGSLRVETGFGSTVLDRQGIEQTLPAEIEANAVWLNALIHPVTNNPTCWFLIAECDANRYPWPEESGGLEAFARIHARCCEIRVDQSKVKEPSNNVGDAVFADLIEPERKRQRRLMIDAIQRLLSLVHPSA